jgi:hypothetical protein
MNEAVSALIPVFLVIVAGYGARASGVVPEAAWAGVNRLAYNILAPTFMFGEIMRAHLTLEELAFTGATMGGFALMGALGFLLLPLSGDDRPAFASAHQGVLRWNTFVILAASAAILGPEASALITLVMGPSIPLVNVITVLVHARWGHGQNPTFRGIVKSLLVNPILIACAAGLILNLAGVRLTGYLDPLARIIGNGALGVTLLCVGAGLAPTAMLARPALMVSAVVLKLAIAPIVFITLGRLAGLDGLHLACLAMIGAAPAPPGAYTLTREMGGDARLMAGLITATTLLSAVMLPLALEFAARLAGSGG